jgi:hypothetical protein
MITPENRLGVVAETLSKSKANSTSKEGNRGKGEPAKRGTGEEGKVGGKIRETNSTLPYSPFSFPARSVTGTAGVSPAWLNTVFIGRIRFNPTLSERVA